MKKNHSNMGIRNRQKGFNAERLYAKKFRDIGYDKCITSRRGSRIHDDSKIDLIFVPFNVQIKAGKQRGLNPASILKSMDETMKINFPEDNSVFENPKILIVEKEVGHGRKRGEFDSLVTMSWDDFVKIIKTKDNDKKNKS